MKTPTEIVIDQIKSGNTEPLSILKVLFDKDVTLAVNDPFINSIINTMSMILDEYYILYDIHDSDIRTAGQTIEIISNILKNKYIK